MLALGALAFANPWMLTALMGLPVLWLLLRITPPAPRVQRFPAIRLLYRLQSTEETPDSAPWWLLLLRLLIAALVIFAVAHPIRNAGEDLPGGGAVVIVVDDDWAAARDWSSRIKVMGGLVDQADRDDRPIFLLRTTWMPDDERDLGKPLTATAARAVIKAMAPRPRSSTLGSLRRAVETAPPPSPADIVWLSNGISDPGETELMETLRRLGRLTIVADESGGPKILVPPSSSGRAIEVEAVLMQHPAVKQAYVVGVPDPAKDEIVAAAVELEIGADVTTGDLIAHCRAELASYKVPTHIAIRSGEDFPRTPTGKIHKPGLKEELAREVHAAG